MYVLMWKSTSAVHQQDVALEVPDDDLVYSDILKTIFSDLSWETRHKTYIICKGINVDSV